MTIWVRQGGWTMESWGNGTAIELRHDDGDSVFVQGDDAIDLKDQWDAMERMFPNRPTGELLRELYHQNS